MAWLYSRFAQATVCSKQDQFEFNRKGMFLQGHLYKPSFPQLKFQMPAPYANKQCILMNKQQHIFL